MRASLQQLLLSIQELITCIVFVLRVFQDNINEQAIIFKRNLFSVQNELAYFF